MTYDAFCNKYDEFLTMICKGVETDNNISLAEFDAKTGLATKAVSYLLPNCPIDVFDTEDNSIRLIEENLKEERINRLRGADLTITKWDITKKHYPYKDYQLLYTHNLLNRVKETEICDVWDMVASSADKVIHCMDWSPHRDMAYYLGALGRRSTRIYTNPHQNYLVIRS